MISHFSQFFRSVPRWGLGGKRHLNATFGNILEKNLRTEKVIDSHFCVLKRL